MLGKDGVHIIIVGSNGNVEPEATNKEVESKGRKYTKNRPRGLSHTDVLKRVYSEL